MPRTAKQSGVLQAYCTLIEHSFREPRNIRDRVVRSMGSVVFLVDPCEALHVNYREVLRLSMRNPRRELEDLLKRDSRRLVTACVT